MEWIINQLRVHPELAIFLTLFAGFWIGRLKIGKFSLGTVTSVLLVGVLVGQLDITVDGPMKAVFFLLFLFAVGYKVGPQFFRGLKKDGLPQVGFAVLMCIVSLVSAWALAKIMGYHVGEAAGLLAGSQTISAVIGVAEDTINTLYFSFRYFNPSMLPGIRGAVLKKPLLLTCFSKEGKASSSVFPYMFSMFSLIPESLYSKMINWAYTSANTPSMSTKICCLILLSFINN